MSIFRAQRHRWRILIPLTVFVLGMGYLASELWRMRDVKQQFDETWQNWQSFRTNAENVVLTSARLRDAEDKALWINTKTANERHVRRMQVLLEGVENPRPDTPPHVVERDTELIRRELKKQGSLPPDDS